MGASSRKPRTQGHGPASHEDPWPFEFSGNTRQLVADPVRTTLTEPTRKAGNTMSTVTCRTFTELPCHIGDPDMWFSEKPADLERAKGLCED